MTQRTKILLIYTGGTIGMVKDYETGVLRPFRFEKIKERLPELSQLDSDINHVSQILLGYGYSKVFVP